MYRIRDIESKLIDRHPYPWVEHRLPEYFRILGEKIIFLNKNNLFFLEGYKAYLSLTKDGELKITITGLSPKSAKVLFNQIKEMRKNEVRGK